MSLIRCKGLKSPNLTIDRDKIDNKILMKKGIEINEFMNNLKQIERRIREMQDSHFNYKCVGCIIL